MEEKECWDVGITIQQNNAVLLTPIVLILSTISPLSGVFPSLLHINTVLLPVCSFPCAGAGDWGIASEP